MFDLSQESKVLFHVIGLKCQECGSYNTCRTADREENGDATETAVSDTSNGPTNGADGASGDGPGPSV